MGEEIACRKKGSNQLEEEAINISVDNGEQDFNVDESTVPVPPLPTPFAVFLYVIAMIATISITILFFLAFANTCIQYGPVSVEAGRWLLIVMTCYCASSATLWYNQAYMPQLTPDKKQGGDFHMQRAKVSLKVYCAFLFISIYLFIYGKWLEDAKVPSYMINLTYLVSAVSLVFNLVTLVYSLVILRKYYCSRGNSRLSLVCSIQDEEVPLITSIV